MPRILYLGAFTVLCSLMCVVKCEEGQCRQLEFRAALAFRGKRLLNHKIKEVDNVAKDFCGALCFIEPNCISYNILVSNDSPSITKCEMNNATHFEHPSDLMSFPNSIYRGSKSACIKKPCPSNAICQAGFSSEGYRCVCVPGYTGEDCAEDVDECSLGEHKCDSNAECRNNVGSYSCKCKEGFSGDGRTCSDIDECALVNNNCTKGGANCTNTLGSFNCTCQTQYFWNGIECEADGCYNYSILNDDNRKSSYDTPPGGELCDNKLSKGWYRFEGDAGTKMPTERVPAYRCGTDWSDHRPQVDFSATLAFRGKRLLNHTIKEIDIVAKDICEAVCSMVPTCVSYNILVSSDSPTITKCEMNDATHFEHPSDLVSFPNSTYRGSKKPCPSNTICQAGSSSEGYTCVCVPGYVGKDCTKDVDECSLGEHKCDSDAECINTLGSYGCKCKEGFSGDGQTCSDIDECALVDNICTKGGANCANTVGSFNCTCQTTYLWNGIKCEADDCHNYSILSNADRKSTYVTPHFSEGVCDSSLHEGWYRFVGAAGTKMPTTPVDDYRCNTARSGWLNGAEPTEGDGEVERKVCFTRGAYTCRNSIEILIKNFGSYFIYKLVPPPACNYRYCGTD